MASELYDKWWNGSQQYKPWRPGVYGKGFILPDGRVYSWSLFPNDWYGHDGDPAHADAAQDLGIIDTPEYRHVNAFWINPNGTFSMQSETADAYKKVQENIPGTNLDAAAWHFGGWGPEPEHTVQDVDHWVARDDAFGKNWGRPFIVKRPTNQIFLGQPGGMHEELLSGLYNQGISAPQHDKGRITPEGEVLMYDNAEVEPLLPALSFHTSQPLKPYGSGFNFGKVANVLTPERGWEMEDGRRRPFVPWEPNKYGGKGLMTTKGQLYTWSLENMVEPRHPDAMEALGLSRMDVEAFFVIEPNNVIVFDDKSPMWDESLIYEAVEKDPRLKIQPGAPDTWHFGAGEFDGPEPGEFDQPWEPGNRGKGLVLRDGSVRTWHFEGIPGDFFGHHVRHPEVGQVRNFIEIDRDGSYNLIRNDPESYDHTAADVAAIGAHDPRLRFTQDWRFGRTSNIEVRQAPIKGRNRLWLRRAQGSHSSPVQTGYRALCRCDLPTWFNSRST
jgi:hypothetical protein